MPDRPRRHRAERFGIGTDPLSHPDYPTHVHPPRLTSIAGFDAVAAPQALFNDVQVHHPMRAPRTKEQRRRVHPIDRDLHAVAASDRDPDADRVGRDAAMVVALTIARRRVVDLKEELERKVVLFGSKMISIASACVPWLRYVAFLTSPPE